MKNLKNYHQPILDKLYSEVYADLEVIEKCLQPQQEAAVGWFGMLFEKLKKVLFYELPVEFEIEQLKPPETAANKSVTQNQQENKEIKVA
ncbi:MAG: hypothetical protein PHW04_13705 [Candidatus Wallbacteria bacterium]|nr:hypothetical protein [Candidatus Wallbacteria bacterium]